MAQTIALVIDPDETSRRFLAQMLQKKEFHVLEASNGKQGLDALANSAVSIVITEINMADYTVDELLKKMRQEKHTSSIPVVVMTGNPEPEAMEHAMKAGVAEYYLRSGSSIMTMINSLPQIILEAKRQHPEDKTGVLCVFVSAKGGTGTSSLCANIAMNIAKNMSNSTVALADMVLPIGSIAQIVGYADDFNLIPVTNLEVEEYTSDYFRKNLIVPPQWAFHLLPGSPDPAAGANLRVDHIPDIIKTLRATYDYVLVDFGRSLSRISLPIIQQADAVVLVTSTDLSTVALTKKTLKFLEDHGVKPTHIYPLLNRAVGLEGLSKVEAEKMLGIDIRLTMPYMMSNFTLANNQNQPISIKFPTDTASMIIKQGALEISEMAIKNQEKSAA